MGTKVKISGGTKVKVKKKPVKAGSSNTNKTGGIFISKTIAIAKKRKKKKNG